ncbi:MAG: hypothetical protein IIC67_04815, partial [Thaumarchaeota archaeon]|nr:hypothetical protein [Nitrososphaerota archaeon]
MKPVIIAVIIVILVVAIGALMVTEKETVSDTSIINNFEECIAAGNPAMESYPRQCRTEDGKHFVEVLETRAVPKAMIYTINPPVIPPEKGYFVDEIA